MCTVQVLLFADVTKRRAGGVEYDDNNNSSSRGPLPGEGICRRLFVDDVPGPRPSALLRTLEADLERRVKERWNFDFRTGQPLPGRYQWVGVRPDEDSSAPVTEVPRKSDSRETTEEGPCGRRPRPSTKRNAPSATQSKITDFLQQRKRHRTDCDGVFSPKLKSRRLRDVAATSH